MHELIADEQDKIYVDGKRVDKVNFSDDGKWHHVVYVTVGSPGTYSYYAKLAKPD